MFSRIRVDFDQIERQNMFIHEPLLQNEGGGHDNDIDLVGD